MDFRSPMRQLPGIQDLYNRKGLISNRGEKKQAFFLLQKTYKDWAIHGGASAGFARSVPEQTTRIVTTPASHSIGSRAR
jgi:hypothetical protein